MALPPLYFYPTNYSQFNSGPDSAIGRAGLPAGGTVRKKPINGNVGGSHERAD